MVSSSQPPEGASDRCPVCGRLVPRELLPGQQCLRCGHCGYLIWFDAPTRRTDERSIERTRRQIRSLVQDISQFSEQEITPEQYLEEFLPCVVAAMAAIGGAIWMKNDAGELGLRFQVNLHASHLMERSEEDQIRHNLLLQKVMTSGEGFLVSPHSGIGDNERAANPIDWLLVFGPLKAKSELMGVVEVFQRTEASPRTQQGYLRFLRQMCELASNSVALRRHNSTPQTRISKEISWWKFWRWL